MWNSISSRFIELVAKTPLLRPSAYLKDQNDRLRASLLAIFIIVHQSVLVIFLAYLWLFPEMARSAANQQSTILGLIAGLIIGFISLALARTRHYRGACLFFLAGGMLGILYSVLNNPDPGTIAGATVWPSLFAVLCSLILPGKYTFGFVLIAFATYGALALLIPQESLPLLVSNIIFFIGTSSLALIGIIVRDRIERQLALEHEKVLRASKLAALGEMAGGLAHEINTPLGSIMLLSSSLQMYAKAGTLDINEVVEIGCQIEGVTERIGKIIHSMRTFSRNNCRDEMAIFPVAGLVESALQLCKTRFANHGIKLEIAPIAKDLTIFGQSTQLSQVLLNLLNNAHDAVMTSKAKFIKIDCLKINGCVEISVTDSGPGIDADHIEKIFQPFFTTKPPGQGTGLGLSISQSIMEAHQGTLSLDRNSSMTRFVMRVPESSAAEAS